MNSDENSSNISSIESSSMTSSSDSEESVGFKSDKKTIKSSKNRANPKKLTQQRSIFARNQNEVLNSFKIRDSSRSSCS